MPDQAIVVGSLSDVAERTVTGALAESFVGAKCVAIIDLSGSMELPDGKDNLPRYQVAFNELAKLQADMPGEVAVIGFADSTMFFPGGKPVMGLCGFSTNLARALDFARLADVEGIRFVLVSDGQPNDELDALEAACKFQNRIDVIHIGSGRGSGVEFLEKLSKMSGGQLVARDHFAGLAESAQNLLAEGER